MRIAKRKPKRRLRRKARKKLQALVRRPFSLSQFLEIARRLGPTMELAQYLWWHDMQVERHRLRAQITAATVGWKHYMSLTVLERRALEKDPAFKMAYSWRKLDEEARKKLNPPE